MGNNKTYRDLAKNARQRSNGARDSSDAHWHDLAKMKQRAEKAAEKLKVGQDRQRQRQVQTSKKQKGPSKR